jgi:type II secretory ATPase GspE/PulE/Tfp pilus assembly ATPase PilB-like protein
MPLSFETTQKMVSAGGVLRATQAIVTADVRGDPRAFAEPDPVAHASHAGGATVLPLHIKFADYDFHRNEINSPEELASLMNFHQVVNAEVGLDMFLGSRVALLRLNKSDRELCLLAERNSTNPDEIKQIHSVAETKGYRVTMRYFAQHQLIVSLTQGHLTSERLMSTRTMLRDPNKSAYFQTFLQIVGWAYDQKADDIDWVLNLNSGNNSSGNNKSQVCFKISGCYVRPSLYVLDSQMMHSILSTAWQRTLGGSQAQFDVRNEHQSQIEVTLPEARERKAGIRLRLRWSGLPNDDGIVVTMRLQRLGEATLVHSLDEAGYLQPHMHTFHRVLNSEGGMVCFSGVVGSGKSTSLARLLAMMSPHKKIQTIEDPVELVIPRAYQKSIARDLHSTSDDKAFIAASRALYRSALDVLLLGEIRDRDTGGVARQVLESGHSVYTTTHARSALGIIDRLSSPQVDVPRTVLGAPDILKLLVYQSLLPVNCPHCSKTPSDWISSFGLTGAKADQIHRYFDVIERIYGLNRDRFKMRDHRGCSHCRNDDIPELNGFSGRTVVCEMIEPTDDMLELILAGRSLELHRLWRSHADGRFDTEDLTGKTAMECAIYKAQQGLIDPREIEPRFQAFATIEAKQTVDVNNPRLTST